MCCRAKGASGRQHEIRAAAGSAGRGSWGARGYQQDTWFLDLLTGKARILVESGARPHFLAESGHLLFSRGPALMAVSLDRSSWTTRGETVAVLDGLRANNWSNGAFSVSADGHLIFEPGGRLGGDRRIVTVNASKEVLPFIADARPYESHLSTSLDGRQVSVVIANARGTFEAWTASVDRPGIRRTLSLPNADSSDAEFSPDGRWLAFTRYGRDKEDGIYIQPVDGSGEPRSVLKAASTEEFLIVRGWTPDSTEIVADRAIGGRSDLIAVSIASATKPISARVVRATPASEVGARISPDGRLVAFQSDESGRGEVYVCAMVKGVLSGQPLLVSSGGGGNPRWSRDSRKLYFMTPTDLVMVATVESASRASTAVVAWDLRALRINPDTWDVLPDGRLIGVQRGAGEDDVTSYGLVLNWLNEIRPRLPK
jgi:serine/threonine-protein kinase